MEQPSRSPGSAGRSSMATRGVKTWGVCLYGLRRIVIRRGLTKAEEIGVVMHEAIHAGGYYLNEEAVETIEYAIMGALKATGNLPCED
jgi:hypothetical protein